MSRIRVNRSTRFVSVCVFWNIYIHIYIYIYIYYIHIYIYNLEQNILKEYNNICYCCSIIISDVVFLLALQSQCFLRQIPFRFNRLLFLLKRIMVFSHSNIVHHQKLVAFLKGYTYSTPDRQPVADRQTVALDESMNKLYNYIPPVKPDGHARGLLFFGDCSCSLRSVLIVTTGG